MFSKFRSIFPRHGLRGRGREIFLCQIYKIVKPIRKSLGGRFSSSLFFRCFSPLAGEGGKSRISFAIGDAAKFYYEIIKYVCKLPRERTRLMGRNLRTFLIYCPSCTYRGKAALPSIILCPEFYIRNFAQSFFPRLGNVAMDDKRIGARNLVCCEAVSENPRLYSDVFYRDFRFLWF